MVWKFAFVMVADAVTNSGVLDPVSAVPAKVRYHRENSKEIIDIKDHHLGFKRHSSLTMTRAGNKKVCVKYYFFLFGYYGLSYLRRQCCVFFGWGPKSLGSGDFVFKSGFYLAHPAGFIWLAPCLSCSRFAFTRLNLMIGIRIWYAEGERRLHRRWYVGACWRHGRSGLNWYVE